MAFPGTINGVRYPDIVAACREQGYSESDIAEKQAIHDNHPRRAHRWRFKDEVIITRVSTRRSSDGRRIEYGKRREWRICRLCGFRQWWRDK